MKEWYVEETTGRIKWRIVPMKKKCTRWKPTLLELVLTILAGVLTVNLVIALTHVRTIDRPVFISVPALPEKGSTP